VPLYNSFHTLAHQCVTRPLLLPMPRGKKREVYSYNKKKKRFEMQNVTGSISMTSAGAGPSASDKAVKNVNLDRIN
jgi:hypothetical protein